MDFIRKFIREDLYTPSDIASLIFFRICFGALAVWEVVRFFYHGWVEHLYAKAKKMNYSISEKYYQHFVVAIGSGSSPHLHNNAWNVLWYGKKLWNLWQPGHSFISNIPTLNYVEQNEQVEDQFVKQCVQNRGDIILVPNQWGHSTFSLMENVGIASEFDVHLSL